MKRRQMPCARAVQLLDYTLIAFLSAAGGVSGAFSRPSSSLTGEKRLAFPARRRVKERETIYLTVGRSDRLPLLMLRKPGFAAGSVVALAILLRVLIAPPPVKFCQQFTGPLNGE